MSKTRNIVFGARMMNGATTSRFNNIRPFVKVAVADNDLIEMLFLDQVLKVHFKIHAQPIFGHAGSVHFFGYKSGRELDKVKTRRTGMHSSGLGCLFQYLGVLGIAQTVLIIIELDKRLGQQDDTRHKNDEGKHPAGPHATTLLFRCQLLPRRSTIALCGSLTLQALIIQDFGYVLLFNINDINIFGLFALFKVFRGGMTAFCII
mmetsp:Transcript_37477/g.77738  ORF Transcript_37477/g.77738 Transcript_37477/m.77738 type:complete len:205 (+) Transcript_37477:505-1119(+)